MKHTVKPSRATKSPPSVCSLDIEDILASAGDQSTSLLSETLSLPSSFEPSDDVPPFPADRRPPMVSILGLGTHLPLFPDGRWHLNGFSTEEKYATAILAAPTPPRLRAMMKESLSIRAWAENIEASNPPGHIPWAGQAPSAPAAWVPEGSFFPPEVLHKALSDFRRSSRRISKVRDVEVPSSKKSQGEPISHAASRSVRGRSCLLPNAPSFREALVFEREITLGPTDQRKHWSLQVPAANMNPEMVDMVLQLQDLNTFFMEGSEQPGEQPPEPTGEDHGDNNYRVPPFLVVSNSTTAMPISFSSSTNQETDSTMAARRGRKVPAPLDLNADSNPYPGIPTAFLSPSEQISKIHDSCGSEASSMDLEDMVASLRSKCASMCQFPDALSHETQPPGMLAEGDDDCFSPAEAATLPTASASASDDEDEWAFAKDLLESCREHPLTLDTFAASLGGFQHLPRDSSTDSQLESGPVTAAVETHEGRDLIRSNSPYPPPSSPLPPNPPSSSTTTVNRASPVPRVRGILKSCKNVRFASLPSRKGRAPTFDETPPALPPRRSTGGTDAISSLRQPLSPCLRGAAARTASLRPAADVSGEPTTTPARPASSLLLLSPKQHPKSMTLRPRNSFSTAAAALPAKHLSPSPVPVPAQKGGRLRHRSIDVVTKENRARALSSPPTTTNATTSSHRSQNAPDENTARRTTMGAITPTSASASPPPTASSIGRRGSRMPVPLRNILTRFK